MSAHLAPDPLPFYPHPFVKRLDAMVVSPGTYQLLCQNEWHMSRIRARLHAAAVRSGRYVTTSYDKCTGVLTVTT